MIYVNQNGDLGDWPMSVRQSVSPSDSALEMVGRLWRTANRNILLSLKKMDEHELNICILILIR